MRFPASVALALILCGCMLGGVPPMQRVSDAARETNVATQFGQIEVALSHVAPSARQAFLERRAQWGQSVRILEVEMVGIRLLDEEHATASVAISWSSVKDSLLRATQVTQEWENRESGWLLVRERRQSGELGLFGETLTNLTPPHPDVHHPSRTLSQD